MQTPIEMNQSPPFFLFPTVSNLAAGMMSPSALRKG
jgi:hypothetical protein